MSFSINNNIPAMRAANALQRTSRALGKSYLNISSGVRDASEDVAGTSIAAILYADQRIANAAIRNVNDGISLISIADSALENTTNVLFRMLEIAHQSANGVYQQTARSALQLEFVALGSEISRIANVTEFNGMKLLNEEGSISLQVGFNSRSYSEITFAKSLGTLMKLTIGSGVQLGIAVIGSNVAASLQKAYQAITAIEDAIAIVGIERGNLGATESRLNSTIQGLQIAQENFAEAVSRIRDVDIAEEAAELTRNNILQQAGIAVLAQANQQPELLLKLLQ